MNLATVYANKYFYLSSMPNGHQRWDPSTMRVWSGPGLPAPSIAEMSERERTVRGMW